MLLYAFLSAGLAAIVYAIVSFNSKKISFFHVIPALLFLIPCYLFIADGSYSFFVAYIFFSIAFISLVDIAVDDEKSPFAGMLSVMLFGFPCLISTILFVIFLITGIVHHKNG